MVPRNHKLPINHQKQIMAIGFQNSVRFGLTISAGKYLTYKSYWLYYPASDPKHGRNYRVPRDNEMLGALHQDANRLWHLLEGNLEQDEIQGYRTGD